MQTLIIIYINIISPNFNNTMYPNLMNYNVNYQYNYQPMDITLLNPSMYPNIYQ